MKRMTLGLSILCLMLSSRAGVAGPATIDSLTIERAVRMTIERHPAVQQARSAMGAASARVAASRSPFYPDVSFAGLYTLLEPVPSMDIPHMGSFELYPENNYDFHIGIRQTLYDFGRVATGVRLAESARKTAGDNVDVIMSALAYRTIDVFNTMLILQRTVRVIDEQIAALGQHLDISAKRIRAGTATDFDSLTTEVRIASARNDRIDAVRALANNRIVLRQLTGMPQDEPLCVKGSLAAAVRAIDSDSALAQAERLRPELVVARDAERSASVQARLASLGNRPTLTLGVTSGYKNGYVPDLNEMKLNLAAGVQLAVPLFNGYRVRHQREEAEANLRAAQAHTADIERQVTSEVEQAVAGAQSSREKMENSTVLVRQAEAALARAEAQYEAGVATNLDLLDAQTALSQAKLIHLRSIYDYMVASNALDRATGRKVW